MLPKKVKKNIDLTPVKTGYDRRVELFEKISDIIGPIPDDKIEVETLFLRGGRSGYVLPEDFENIKARVPGAHIETIEGAGHWLHAEAPAAFLNHVTRFLADT